MIKVLFVKNNTPCRNMILEGAGYLSARTKNRGKWNFLTSVENLSKFKDELFCSETDDYLICVYPHDVPPFLWTGITVESFSEASIEISHMSKYGYLGDAAYLESIFEAYQLECVRTSQNRDRKRRRL